jgi:hypothetical protein
MQVVERGGADSRSRDGHGDTSAVDHDVARAHQPGVLWPVRLTAKYNIGRAAEVSHSEVSPLLTIVFKFVRD